MSSFRDKSPADLITAIALEMHRPPLSDEKHIEKQKLTELGIILLLLDFDAEVQSGGILGFLENPTGPLLDQTIEAFRRIGAHGTAGVLVDIRDVLNKHGTSPEKLRENVKGEGEFAISTFNSRQGDQSSEMADEIQLVGKQLYIYTTSRQSPYLAIERFIESHVDAVVSQVEGFY